jgi:predicted membrane-bound spermidine synthase
MEKRWIAGAASERALSIFVLSVFILFLEVMLIRWVSTEIRIFAYLQNTVLVVCFLGLGVGCLTCRKPFLMRNLLLPMLALVLLLAISSTRQLFASISVRLSTLDDLLIWYGGVSNTPWQTALDVMIGLALTLVIMVLLAEIFVPMGRLLGRLMDDHPKAVVAYSWNVLGSLVGVWLFVLLSALHQPPVTWFAVVAVLALFFVDGVGRQRIFSLALLIAIVGLSWLAGQEVGTTEVVWSPYQKLSVLKPANTFGGKYIISVNNAGYQGLIDQVEASSAQDPTLYPPNMRGFTQYDLPFLLHSGAKTALLVGAGSGNDAAGALRHGVAHVTAVEIDPAIIALGRRYHPERPYESRAVSVIVDDARSFFARTHESYDVISFGLLDAHTTTTMTNTRLDHYVYTRESLERAKNLLNQGGILTLTFAVQRPFIADRIAGTLRDVFGEDPLWFGIPTTGYGWGGVMFVAGDLKGARSRIDAIPGLAPLIADWQQRFPAPVPYTTAVATDDWPYLYLQSRRIPVLYYLLAGLLLILLILFRWQLNTPEFLVRWPVSHWHFFFLGAAFLLLEVQNISKASVVLGNTWLVNAVIISAVLIMILLANAIVAISPRIPMGIVYSLLCGSCLALYFIDLSRFAFMPYGTKALAVGALTCFPMLFSGIVFINSFRVTAERDAALGANLIGALVGALLQSVTFVTGIKVLLLLVATLYCLAMLTAPRCRGVST